MATTDGKIDARWVAAYEAELGGDILIPGESVARITRGEAEESANWEPVKAAKSKDAD